MAQRVFERVVRAAGRRPQRVLAIVALLAAIGAVGALRLEPSAATDTLVGRSSDSFQATERYRERFGDHSIVVLVRGDLPQIVLTENLGRLVGLEGCLSGNKPAEVKVPAGGPRGPCARLAQHKPVQVVYGPGTFINAAVGEIQDQFRSQLAAKAAEAKRARTAATRVARARGYSKARQKQAADSAEQLVYAEFTRDTLQLAVRYGLKLNQLPQINDPDFVSSLVFDASQGASTPKARFAYLFPNNRSAVIQVRLKPDLSESQRATAIADVRAAVGMREWRLRSAGYTVTGAPVVVEDVTDALASSLVRLLVVALLVMAATLAIVFHARLRLLPLFVALAAVAITFGLMALIGASLTMASIAVLPVLLGLGVDYAIQYQARVEEAGGDAVHAARVAVPTIAAAGTATAVGFLVLLLSPVPMVRGFGALLVVGILFAFVLALSAGTAALVGGRHKRAGPEGALARSWRGAGELVQAAAGRARRLARAPTRRRVLLRGVVVVALAAGAGALGWWDVAGVLVVGMVVGTLVEHGVAGRWARGVLRGGLARPGRILALGLVLAAAGWAVDSHTEVVSDVRDLVPQDLPALRDLATLQDTTAVSGEIDVLVEGADMTDPKVVTWMRDYQSKLLARFRYSRKNGCGKAELCPALSLPDLFRTPQASSDQKRIRALLDAVPPYFSQAVISRDRRTANLAFGIKLLPLERQHEIVEIMRDELRPPRGVRAELAGLPVLAAEANDALASPLRRLGTLVAGLLAVALALLAIYRRWDRAWVPLVPIALATGWSALVLFALRVPLNPMSATLGALVIAISTEFAVLLAARYREERAAGHEPAEALRRTYASTGAVVLASGATAIAGFAVLAFSDVQMLKDFGRVTVVDLSVSLLGVLAVLPAVLVLAERRAARAGAATPEHVAPGAREVPVAG